jgi:rhodanese-related sulfurtransferase
MERFNAKLGAGILVGLAGAYLVAVAVTGRSARADVPPDLSAKPADLALDVWKAAALVVDQGAAVVDLRPADAFARYHLPGARSMPGADPAAIAAAAKQGPVLLYAGKDEVARKAAADARALAPAHPVHLLADGARAWYLALTLPVPLFAESAPPDGYAEALAAVNGYLERPDPAARARTSQALQVLARANFQPTLLGSGKKAAAGGGAKKKIAGGCG